MSQCVTLRSRFQILGLAGTGGVLIGLYIGNCNAPIVIDNFHEKTGTRLYVKVPVFREGILKSRSSESLSSFADADLLD
jgi:hypothetical protein